MLSLRPYQIPYLKKYKNGKQKLVKVKTIKWFSTPHRTIHVQREGEYQNIVYTQFNPGSRPNIVQWMEEDYNYTFKYYTKTGLKKADADSLDNMEHPAGKLLRRYLKVCKDQSQLEAGKGSLMNNYNEQTRTISSRVDTNGAVTGRFTTSSVNLAQVPAQKEFRELFAVPKGWVFMGTDFSGQENVNLAEMLYPYDNGRLKSIIDSGDKSIGTDLHSLNAKACGIGRNDAKPLWFGMLYGSSATLTGYTLLGNKDFDDYTTKEYSAMHKKLLKRKIELLGEALYPIDKGTLVPFNEQLHRQALFGAKVQRDLIESTIGLKELVQDLKAKAKANGYLTTLGGRNIPIRHQHAALNTQLQSMGAEAMKLYLHFYHTEAKRRGLTHLHEFKQQACIYDEVDLLVLHSKASELADILSTTYKKVSDKLNMKCEYTGEIMTGNNWYSCH